MTPAPALNELITTVQHDCPTDDPLDLLATASTTVTELSTVGDAVLDHFVAGARRAGRSWSEISGILGVSKQAAHKRFSAPRAEGVTVTLKAGNFSRFTDRARRTVVAAVEIAKSWGHNYVGTEHVLAAQFTEPQGIAARVLAARGVTREAVEATVFEFTPRGEPIEGDGHLTFTPRTQKALEEALREALELGHNYLGTEHQLLGILAVGDGLAARVLADLGVTLPEVRADVVAALETLVMPPAPEAS
jgi:hypothetical protein